MALPFVKMHGLGNDFVVIDDLGKPGALMSPLTPELAVRLCDRRFGVGADQVLWLKSPRDAALDCRMEIFNADGSVAEMCGNGIRAVALYLWRTGPAPHRERYRIETLAGVMTVEMVGEEVRVDMGVPRLGARFVSGEGLEVGGTVLNFHEVSMGNPHAVIFVPRVAEVELERLGPLVERHSRFPARTNVEFVEVAGPGRLVVRVWERGAGVTLACGTGACASAAAALALRFVRGPVEVMLPGGRLVIEWDGVGSLLMTGPATEVFRGSFLV